jgi:hypothetical protein
MVSTIEFRILETLAPLLFGASEGESVGGGLVRKIALKADDPKLPKLFELQREYRRRGSLFYSSWEIRHEYSKSELAGAIAFRLAIKPTFEPAGRECGTEYDMFGACPYCGWGERQVSGLKLDTSKIPKGCAIARTIADEWIVSQDLAELVIDQRLTGIELNPVISKRPRIRDRGNWEETMAGKQLMEKAKAAGIKFGTSEFHIWLHRLNQLDLYLSATQREDHGRDAIDRTRANSWYQLNFQSPRLRIAKETRIGDDPCEREGNQRGRCPNGHVLGLRLLSELYVNGSALGADFQCTEEMVGVLKGSGLLRPTPLIIVSPRVRRLFEQGKLKGASFDVVYFV